MTFRHCFNFVKDKRGVASPNLGFISQLLNFEKRIDANHDIKTQNNSVNGIYQIFVFTAHQREDSEYFVFRRVDPVKMLVLSQEKEKRENFSDFKLDPRAIIIFVVNEIGSEKTGYVWRGNTLFIL